MFYEKLLEYYGKLDFPPRYQELCKIGKHIAWYLADEKSEFITITKKENQHLVDLDISGAFPTICKALFDKDSDFIKKMNEIDEKKGKNIYIATTLKDSGYLEQLNIICKLIVLGTIFSCSKDPEDILILELKKDGCLFVCDDDTFFNINNLKDLNNNFINFVLKYNFIFHNTDYYNYIRSNKTSLFVDLNNNIIAKGIYKYKPKEIHNIIKDLLLFNKEIDEKRLLKIYSNDCFNIIRQNGLRELLNDYYICDNGKILSQKGRYEKFSLSTEIDPRLYLRLFVFPIILSKRIEFN